MTQFYDVQNKLKELLNGNEEAFAFVTMLWNFVTVWDDAVDRDKSLMPEDINQAMRWAWLDMESSPFYTEHKAALKPALYMAVISWIAANSMERTGKRPLLEQSYVLRCSPFDVFVLCVMLVSGFDAAVEAQLLLRSSFQEDSMESYLKEHMEV